MLVAKTSMKAGAYSPILLLKNGALTLAKHGNRLWKGLLRGVCLVPEEWNTYLNEAVYAIKKRIAQAFALYATLISRP